VYHVRDRLVDNGLSETHNSLGSVCFGRVDWRACVVDLGGIAAWPFMSVNIAS
jgi:hypothetical protein